MVKMTNELLKKILIDIRRLRASIPLTYGKVARKQARELIEKLEKVLEGKK